MTSANKRSSKKSNLDFDEDGKPPWMGTLRHVHGPKASKNFKTRASWQKRYPEEDAPNPFQSKLTRLN